MIQNVNESFLFLFLGFIILQILTILLLPFSMAVSGNLSIMWTMLSLIALYLICAHLAAVFAWWNIVAETMQEVDGQELMTISSQL